MFHLDVHDLIRHYGYPAIFFFLFIENFGIPVPGQAFFIVAIWLTAKGELQLLPVALTAFVASVLGGTVGFAIGRRGGHKVLQEYGRYIWITPERLAKAEGFFAQYGGGVIVLRGSSKGCDRFTGFWRAASTFPGAASCSATSPARRCGSRCGLDSCCGSAATSATSGRCFGKTSPTCCWGSVARPFSRRACSTWSTAPKKASRRAPNHASARRAIRREQRPISNSGRHLIAARAALGC